MLSPSNLRGKICWNILSQRGARGWSLLSSNFCSKLQTSQKGALSFLQVLGPSSLSPSLTLICLGHQKIGSSVSAALLADNTSAGPRQRRANLSSYQQPLDCDSPFSGRGTMSPSPFRNINSNAPAGPGLSTQLTSSFAAHHHQCNRFCSFKYLFGNVWLCTSSGKHHVCDRTCDQRVFWGESTTDAGATKLPCLQNRGNNPLPACRKPPHHLQTQQNCDAKHTKFSKL